MMVKTPGFVLPSSFSSTEELRQDLQRRAKDSGFEPFNPADFAIIAHEEVPMTTEVDNYLEHFGVKGMKWGKHTSSSSSSDSSSKGSARKDLRELNKKAKVEIKAEKKADKVRLQKEWDDEVLGARDRLGKEGEQLSAARKQYKVDKKVIGRAAAKKTFKEHEKKFINTYNIASLNTTKENHQAMVATVGLMALSAVVAGASSAMGD